MAIKESKKFFTIEEVFSFFKDDVIIPYSIDTADKLSHLSPSSYEKDLRVNFIPAYPKWCYKKESRENYQKKLEKRGRIMPYMTSRTLNGLYDHIKQQGWDYFNKADWNKINYFFESKVFDERGLFRDFCAAIGVFTEPTLVISKSIAQAHLAIGSSLCNAIYNLGREFNNLKYTDLMDDLYHLANESRSLEFDESTGRVCVHFKGTEKSMPLILTKKGENSIVYSADGNVLYNRVYEKPLRVLPKQELVKELNLLFADGSLQCAIECEKNLPNLERYLAMGILTRKEVNYPDLPFSNDWVRYELNSKGKKFLGIDKIKKQSKNHKQLE